MTGYQQCMAARQKPNQACRDRDQAGDRTRRDPSRPVETSQTCRGRGGRRGGTGDLPPGRDLLRHQGPGSAAVADDAAPPDRWAGRRLASQTPGRCRSENRSGTATLVRRRRPRAHRVGGPGPWRRAGPNAAPGGPGGQRPDGPTPAGRRRTNAGRDRRRPCQRHAVARGHRQAEQVARGRGGDRRRHHRTVGRHRRAADRRRGPEGVVGLQTRQDAGDLRPPRRPGGPDRPAQPWSPRSAGSGTC